MSPDTVEDVNQMSCVTGIVKTRADDDIIPVDIVYRPNSANGYTILNRNTGQGFAPPNHDAPGGQVFGSAEPEPSMVPAGGWDWKYSCTPVRRSRAPVALDSYDCRGSFHHKDLK